MHLMQAGAITALRDCGEFAARQQQLFQTRRDAVLEELAPLHRHIQCVPPEGGMFVLINVAALGISSLQFATRVLEEAHVAILPADAFGDAAKGHVRMGLVADEPVLREVSFPSQIVYWGQFRLTLYEQACRRITGVVQAIVGEQQKQVAVSAPSTSSPLVTFPLHDETEGGFLWCPTVMEPSLLPWYNRFLSAIEKEVSAEG